MPRPADPTTRARILDAAGRLFYERGIRAVGTAEIVAAAGCGKNALYRHFATKDDLVLAYLQAMADRLDPELEEVVAGLRRVPSGALVAISRLVADRAAAPEFRGCPFRNYLRETRDASDAPGRFALAEVVAVRARIDDLVADLGTEDPAVVADRIWLVLEGLYASAPYGDPAEAATTAVGLVQEILAAA